MKKHAAAELMKKHAAAELMQKHAAAELMQKHAPTKHHDALAVTRDNGLSEQPDYLVHQRLLYVVSVVLGFATFYCYLPLNQTIELIEDIILSTFFNFSRLRYQWR